MSRLAFEAQVEISVLIETSTKSSVRGGSSLGPALPDIRDGCPGQREPVSKLIITKFRFQSFMCPDANVANHSI